MPANDDEAILGDSDEEITLKEATVLEAIALTDISFTISSRWHVRADKFHSLARSRGIDPESENLMPIRKGLSYFLQSEERGGRRQVSLRSSWLDPSTGKPSNPKAESGRTVATWAKVAREADSPAARAHFLDLLVLKGGRETHTLARDAVRAYLLAGLSAKNRVETGSGNHDIHVSEDDRSRALGRALSLLHIACQAPKTEDLAETAISAAISHARMLLDSPVPRVGNILDLLGLLGSTSSRLSIMQRDEVVGLARDALSKHDDLTHVVDRAAMLVESLDPSLQEDMRRLRVQARLDIASQRDNAMVAMSFLDDAARLAANLRLPDLADQATRRMQTLGRDGNFGFQAFEASSSIPMEIIEAQILTLCAGATWRDSLESWLTGPPPAGDFARNMESVAQMPRGLVDFLPSVHYGADNLPRWRSETDEDKRLERLSQFEGMHLSTNGSLLAEALDRIKKMHGVPPLEELALFFSGEGKGDYDLSMALARALHRYWNGDMEGGLFTAVMRVEGAARQLVLLLDEPAYVVARTNNQAKYVGLGDLLEILTKHGFDDSWERFIRALFLGPTGRNLRHDLAHGFRLTVPYSAEVALSLRALALFTVLLWSPRSLALHPASQPTPQPAWTIVDMCIDRLRGALASPESAMRVLKFEFAALRSQIARQFESGRN